MIHTSHPGAPARRRFLAASAGLAASTLLAPRAALSRGLGRAPYGQGSIDPFFAAGYVALKRGYFGDNGLEVEYLNSQSGPRTNQLLAAGQILFGATAATSAPAITLAGKPAALIFGFDRKLTYANVIVRRADYESGAIRSLSDLAGKRMGATQPQSSTWLMAVYLMQKAGVADRVDIRPLGDLSTMLGALKTGSVAASMASMSMMEQAQAEGWGMPLFDATADDAWQSFMGGDVPGIAALTLRQTIDQRPEVVQAFVGALVRAQDDLNTLGAAEITDLIYDDYLHAFGRAAIEKTIATYQQTVFLRDNIITEEAYGRLTAIMGDGRQFSNEALRGAAYAQCVDMRFVRKARGMA
ncbi:ABC transporter substrate-binding protein [Bordetella sp. 2513F-2]